MKSVIVLVMLMGTSVFAAVKTECALGKTTAAVELLQETEKSPCKILWKGQEQFHAKNDLSKCSVFHAEMVSQLSKKGYSCAASLPKDSVVK